MKQLAAIYLTLVIQQMFLFLPCYQLQQSPWNKNQRLQGVHDPSKRRRKSVAVEVSVASSDVLEQKRKEEHEKDDRNVEIVEELIGHFLAKDRGNVQLPPGWGKNQVALQTLRKFYQLEEDKKVKEEGIESNKIVSAIYVTPNLKLVDQVLDSLDIFGTFSGIPHQRLIVASQTGRVDESCTTSVDDISAFLTSESEGRLSKKSTSMRFIVSTYHSLPKVGEALKKLGGTINFGIFDEAHRMEGNGKLYGLGLFDENIPIDKRLFATATARNSIKPPRKVDNVRSFLDESLFGKCIVKQTQHESVEQNVTLPITLCALDRNEIVSLVGPSSIDLGNDMISRDSLLPFAIQAAFTKLNVTHAVSFHPSNKRARDFVANAKKILKDDIGVFCVDGTMSVKERDQILENAKRESRSIVANCRLLSTGVDEANWDMVVLADPRRGKMNARQMIGQVTRKAPNKGRGYVLVPILSWTEYDASEEMLEISGGYSTLLSAFKAIVGLDPELREEVLFVIDETSRLGRTLTSEEFPQRVRESFMFPSSMSYEMKAAVMNCAIIEFRNQNTWDKMFDLCLAYRKRESPLTLWDGSC